MNGMRYKYSDILLGSSFQSSVSFWTLLRNISMHNWFKFVEVGLSCWRRPTRVDVDKQYAALQRASGYKASLGQLCDSFRGVKGVQTIAGCVMLDNPPHTEIFQLTVQLTKQYESGCLGAPDSTARDAVFKPSSDSILIFSIFDSILDFSK